MALVVESTNQADYATTNVVITKPTGLSVGDLLVGCVHSDTGTPSTPSGWTQEIIADANTAVAIYTKIADSGDVAASNFTFSTVSGNIAGSLARVTGHTASGYDNGSAGATDNVDATPELVITPFTPTNNNTLLFLIYGFDLCDPITNVVVGGYAINGTNPTWTEIGDQTIVQSGTDGAGFGCAYATQVTATEINTINATASGGAAPSDHAIAIFAIRAKVDTTGTNTLLSVSPTLLSQNGVAGGQGTNTLLSVSPTLNTQSGDSTIPTVWTPITKS